MKTLTAQVSEETLAEIDAMAATANLSREDFVARAIERVARRRQRTLPGDAPAAPPSLSPELQAELDAFFANSEADYDLCVRQITESGRRTLLGVEWKA